jgi:sterol 3beta-glucosyltransferase
LRIGIHAWGSAGDIQPLLALAGGLARAGHEVRLAHSSVDGTDHTASLTDLGYEQRLILSPQSASDRHRISDEMLADTSPRRQLARAMRELLEPVIDPLTQSARELAKWADVLVLNPFAHPLSAAAEAQGKPFVCVYIAATVPTREFPPAGLPHLGPLNLLTWKLLGGIAFVHDYQLRESGTHALGTRADQASSAATLS